MLKGLELKRDIETMLVGINIAKVTGDSTARKTASILSWIKTNTSKGTGGADPSAADGTGTRTDGTQRAFTEARLKSVLSSIWTNGGKPDTIMTGGFNKQVLSTFTGRATAIEETKSKKIVASVDAYEFGFRHAQGGGQPLPARARRAGAGNGQVGGRLSQRPQHDLDPAREDRRLRPAPDPVGIRAGRPKRKGVGRRVRQHHVVSAACERGHGARHAPCPSALDPGGACAGTTVTVH